MATDMTLQTSSLHVKRGGIKLEINDPNNGRGGRMKISNDKLIWFPKDQQKGYEITWQQLGDFAAKNGMKQK